MGAERGLGGGGRVAVRIRGLCWLCDIWWCWGVREVGVVGGWVGFVARGGESYVGLGAVCGSGSGSKLCCSRVQVGVFVVVSRKR